MVSGYNYCGYTAAQHSGAMRLSQCLMAFPAARVGFIGSPAAEWRYLMASRLVTGFAAFCFRQPSISFPRSKVSPFQAQPSRHFLCRVKASDSLSDLELEREGRKVQYRCKNGIFWILLLNIGIFVTDRLFQFREIKSLYLYHNRPFWYQFITSTFCHANWNHLSSNLFFLYIFGKLVEEEEGTLALWLSYLATGAGANMVSWLILPRNAVSVGASGAVFGLFAISVLVKMSWDWRKILEVFILGQFVIDKVMEAAQASTGMAGPLSIGHSSQNVNHIAHLSGALFGVALIFLISQIPSKPSSQNKGKALGNNEKPI